MADRLKYKRSIVSNDAIKQQQQRKKLRRRVFYIFLFIAVNIVFLSAAFLMLLKIKNINVAGNNRYSAEDILNTLSVSLGENIYKYKANEIETEIKEALPYIADVEVRRKLPSTIELAVEEKVATMYMEVGGENFILSSDLLVLELTADDIKTAGLTKLIPGNLKRCIVGEYVKFSDMSSFDVLNTLQKNIEAQFSKGDIVEIDFSTRFDIWLRYKDNYSVFVGNIDDCEMKMKFLKKIIEQLGSEKTGRIDISNAAKGAFKEGDLIKTT